MNRRKLLFLAVLLLASLQGLHPALAVDAVTAITFTIDESGSISSSNFLLQQQGYLEALRRLPADGSIEVAVVYFSSGVTVARPLIALTAASLPSIQAALSKSQVAGSTNMSAGISTSAQILGASQAPTRIICLSTDGQPDSTSATAAAAAAARSAGLLVSPVGIGLSPTGATFLNSIASQPPVPNPATFAEFGTVIVNKIGAGVGNAVNIVIEPNPVDFGVFPADHADLCDTKQNVRIMNASDRTAHITGIRIEGQDASMYRINSVATRPPSFPFDLPPKVSTGLELELVPSSSPADFSFDASLVVTASQTGDPQPREFRAPLVATVDAQQPLCLGLDVADASPSIDKIDSAGRPLGAGGPVSESSVATDLSSGRARPRRGLVADGNARLLLRVESDQPGSIRFEISGPGGAGAQLYPLNFTTNRDADGRTQLDVTLTALNGGRQQATVILRAPERFPGSDQEPQTDLELKICKLENSACSHRQITQRLAIRRAPAVLIHGLWADNSSWESKKRKPGLRPSLGSAYYTTGFFSYNGSEGPSVIMTPDSRGLSNVIDDVCAIEEQREVACTRADLVAHSMGGLMARRFALDNKWFRHGGNFFQGAVRRILSMGTPYQGSPLASLLLYDNSAVHNCLRDEDAQTAGIQNGDVEDAKDWLRWTHKDVGSAVQDLSIGSGLLRLLAGPVQSVPTRALYGNIGRNYDPSLDNFAMRGNIEAAGCDYDEVFGEDSDGIVPVSSATSGGFLKQELSGAAHVGMGMNQNMINAAIESLNGPRDGSFLAAISILPPAAGKAGTVGVTPQGSQRTPVKVALPPFSLTVSNSRPAAGETVVFRATGLPAGITLVHLTEAGSFEIAEDDASPFEWQVEISDTASGTLTYSAFAESPTGSSVSNEVKLTVLPPASGLRQMDFDPNSVLVLSSGTREQLKVTGLYDDGLRRDLTEQVTGTVYSERVVDGLNVSPGDSPVIQILADGLLLARQPGTADVVATNQGISTVRRVVIRAVSETDADGDGLSDTVEAGLGTDRYDPDSDGDGSSDAEEAGSDPSHPRDFNHDGTIDALDATVRAVRDTAGMSVTVSVSNGRLCRLFNLPADLLPPLPASLSGVRTPNGLFDFSVCGLPPGASVDVTLSFEALPAAVNGFLKYAPRTGEGSSEWFLAQGVTRSGNEIRLRLTDNGPGDSDSTDGVIRDPGGPAIAGGLDPAAPIPTLSEWGLMLLILLLIGSGLFMLRLRRIPG